jgi:hypothetical protein
MKARHGLRPAGGQLFSCPGWAGGRRIEALHTGALHLPPIGHQPIQACKRARKLGCGAKKTRGIWKLSPPVAHAVRSDA